MQQENKEKYGFLRLDIQTFGEPNPTGDEGGNGKADPKQTPKYTDEDYDKLKASFDKTSSELADLKKQLKSKMTDDEKKAEEDKLKNEELENTKKELATLKIKSELSDTFEKEEVEKITNALSNGNTDELIKVLKDCRVAFKEKVYLQAKDEFSKSANLPGGNGGNDDSLSNNVQSYIDRKNKKNADLKEKFLGKK